MRSEFELIKHIKKSSEFQHSDQASAIVGIGDDCAVVPRDETHDLVITTDLLVEDIDFRLRWVRPHLLGHKALAVSLSDESQCLRRGGPS